MTIDVWMLYPTDINADRARPIPLPVAHGASPPYVRTAEGGQIWWADEVLTVELPDGYDIDDKGNIGIGERQHDLVLRPNSRTPRLLQPVLRDWWGGTIPLTVTARRDVPHDECMRLHGAAAHA